jgi:predicted chitinase
MQKLWTPTAVNKYAMRQYTREDITRRGFLGGLGAGALAGGAYSLYKQYGEPRDQAEQPQQTPLQLIFAKIHPNGQLLLKTALDSGITGLELAQFMAQASAETGSFTELVEKGWRGGANIRRYEPHGKVKTDNDSVLSKDQILKMVKRVTNPKARVLGNVLVGDGEKFKGRGYFQITGRWNYTDASEDTGLDLVRHPELAADPQVAAQLAIWYWNKRVKPKINNWMDTEAVTKLINPAGHGLALRKSKFDIYRQYLK